MQEARAPNRRRKRLVPNGLTERIITLRTSHPRLGKDKVHAILAGEGYSGSVSTIGRILGDLKKQGRLPDLRYSLYGKTGALIPQKPKKRKKKLRRPQGCRVLEADTPARFIDGMKRCILTSAGTERRTAFAATYTSHGSASAADFLRKALSVLPDCPNAIQTDNGSEFALHFDRALIEHGSTHFHTYPRSPKMNAHVERSNRTLDEEFLCCNRALLRDDAKAFNEKLVDWLVWYNGERPHYALGKVSPLRCIMASLPAEERQMRWTHTKY